MNLHRQGQAFVELVLGIWLVGVTLSALMFCSRWMAIRCWQIQAVRMGLLLKSIPGVTDSMVEAEMKSRFAQGRFQLSPFKETAAARFFNLKKISVSYQETTESIVFHEGGLNE